MNAEIYLTDKCNLSCNFCGAGAGSGSGTESGTLCKREIDINSISRFMSDLKDHGYRYITFSGGEPLIHREFKAAADMACKMGFLVNVTTNGTLIDEEYAAFAARRNIITRISIHSLDRKQFRLVTGGDQDQVTGSVALLKAKGARYAIGMTVSDFNLHQISELARYTAESGASYIRYTPVFGVYNGREYAANAQTIASMIKRIAQQVILYADVLEYEKVSSFAASGWKEVFLTGACSAGSDVYIALGPDMALHACPVLPDYLDVPGGKFRTADAIDHFKTSYQNLISGINVSELKGSCGECIFRDRCRGGCISIKLTMGLGLCDEQPICSYRIIKEVMSQFTAEEKKLLEQYWCSSAMRQQAEGFSCIRQLPVWELHFGRRSYGKYDT